MTPSAVILKVWSLGRCKRCGEERVRFLERRQFSFARVEVTARIVCGCTQTLHTEKDSA